MFYRKDVFEDFANFSLQATASKVLKEQKVLPSYRNQSIDLLCKSIDWFLYEGNTEQKQWN